MKTTSSTLFAASIGLLSLHLALSCAGPERVPLGEAGAGGGGAGTTATGSSASSTTGGMGGAGGATSSASSTSSTGGGGQGGQGGTPCSAGSVICEGSVKKVCDGNGGFTEMADCAPQACAPGVGCAVCAPGSASCSGNISSVCKSDGSGYDTFVCDPEQGVTCDAATGACSGACAPKSLGHSFIGCDYYPTVTANGVQANPFHFAVIVSNTSASPADVKVTQGLATIATTTVAANDVAVITLPWVDSLKQSNATKLVLQGAYRLRSTQPVTVYQYSPLEYTVAGVFSYTNDASILLPVNTWTGNYRVASRATLSTGSPGFYAVVASENNTTVVVTPPSGGGGGVAPGAGIDATGTGTVFMNAGDALEVFSGPTGNPGDVTGTLVAASKPVQVIGGHTGAYVPDGTCCADHLEESIPPLETLSPDYVVTAPLLTAGGNPVPNVVRIIATQNGTTLTYDPPQGGAPTSIPLAGGYVEIVGTAADFEVQANAKIIVAQFLESETVVGGGDPSMTLAVAKQQYRKSYLFHAPTNYTQNFVNVVAPTGATVTLDGASVVGFGPIGGTGYSVARVLLSNSGNGTHAVSSSVAFGISVYGYGDYTSFWYPGGQNLEHL
jgi:hypothetical protein